jgi:Spy/CpxP family protein refolding chaperone
MSNKLGKRILATTLGLVVLLSAAAWAMGPGGGMDHDPARMVEHMSRKLDLSDEQKAEVETLVSSSRQASAQDMQRMRELRGEMRAQANNFDAGKARTIADEIGQITGRLAYQAAETRAGVYQLLNDEQRAQMAQMMEKRGEHRGKKGKGGKGGA